MLRCYLRASTHEQDAERARQPLADFAKSHGQPIAAWYVENASGATSERPELARMLDDANQGDRILVESIDRLTRLHVKDWEKLRNQIRDKGLYVVALDLPTTWKALDSSDPDDMTARFLSAINDFMIEMGAAMAREDYKRRIARQRQGIEKAKAAGKYRGRPFDHAKHQRIKKALDSGLSIRKTAIIAGVSTATVQRHKRDFM